MLNNLHESWQRARWATDRVQAALGGDIQDAETGKRWDPGPTSCYAIVVHDGKIGWVMPEQLKEWSFA